MASPDSVLTPEEVAARLKVTPSLVMAELRRGRLIGTKVGRKWRVLTSEVDAYMHRPAPAPDTRPFVLPAGPGVPVPRIGPRRIDHPLVAAPTVRPRRPKSAAS